jgi:methylenetetrahydrofolate reductase (NADPH)
MKITDLLASRRPAFSFEFFPPRDELGQERLFATVADLRGYQPAYVSVTYGAGGSTRRLTLNLVRRIKAETGIETMAHLTCVGSDRDEIALILDQLAAAGIENILALRGDPPKDQEAFSVPANGFGHADELVAFIRERHPELCIGVAGYPEKHTEAADFAMDLANLKRKVDAGADFIVTQLFFEAPDYLAFVERLREASVKVPTLPGIMPITNVSQIKRFTAMCGAHIPARLLAKLESIQSDANAVRALGVEHAVVQCRELLAHQVPGIHFYTLNRSTATVEILQRLIDCL